MGSLATIGQVEFTADGSEFFFTLRNGMLAFYIADGSGQRLDKVPGATKAIVVGASCMKCHAHATIMATDEVRANSKVTGDASLAVQKLYVDASVFGQQITADSNDYQSALIKLGIAAQDGDPISQVVDLKLSSD